MKSVSNMNSTKTSILDPRDPVLIDLGHWFAMMLHDSLIAKIFLIVNLINKLFHVFKETLFSASFAKIMIK